MPLGEVTVPGLRNVGNSCFFACAIQALASAPAFARRLSSAAEAAAPASLPLTTALLDLLLELRPSRKPQRPADPSVLLAALRERAPADAFAWGQQHDAVEALEALLEAVCQELQKAFVCSQASCSSLADLLQGSSLQASRSLLQWQAGATTSFTGCTGQQMRCTACGRSFPTHLSRFHTLQLPLPQGPGQLRVAAGASLQACLQVACQAIELVSDVPCPRCSLRQTLRQQASANAATSASQHEPPAAEHEEPSGGLLATDSASAACKESGPASPRADESPERATMLVTLQRLSSCGDALPDSEALQRLVAAAGLRWSVRRTRVARSAPIARAPEVLALHLKRSAWTPVGQHLKLGGHVAFPEALDLRPFMDNAAGGGWRPGRCKPLAYQLTAVVVHLGQSRSGHYLLFRKAGMAGEEGSKSAAAGEEPASLAGSAEAAGNSRSAEVEDCWTASGLCTPAGPAPESSSEQDAAAAEAEAVSAWFCVSDHSVRPAELAEVLACEATLLVYARQ